MSQAQAMRRLDDSARLLPGLWSGQAGQRTGSMSQSPAMRDAPRTVPTASRVISPLQAGWPSGPITRSYRQALAPCHRRRRRRNCRRRRRRDMQPRDLKGKRTKQRHVPSKPRNSGGIQGQHGSQRGPDGGSERPRERGKRYEGNPETHRGQDRRPDRDLSTFRI